MAAYAIGQQLGEELCDALGLKSVLSLDLRIRMHEVPTLSVEHLVSIEKGECIKTVIEQYMLVPKHKRPSRNPWSIVSEFDQWFKWEAECA